MSEKFVVIHGHFYQPPRENPWTGKVEREPSAAPFHDWNDRIHRECYGANAFARVLLGDAQVEKIVNNYSRMSFNFGPTLLNWLEEHAPKTYAAILEADRVGKSRCSGHGPAIAQAYNHMILPLADARDRRTQILWGLRDFERRFGRPSEGLWLPECAADTQTLQALADAGIRYAVLSPEQRAADGPPDTRKAYRVALPGGKSIPVFFYDGELARGIAFNGLLNDGAAFARNVLERFDPGGPEGQLVHTATDGESYGHHHLFGEMALAYALEKLDAEESVRLTNYGEYLELYPPAEEARIVSPSSWSCAHGVERWRSACGCTAGGPPGTHQKWRKPLRDALDRLREKAAVFYEREGARLLLDPWGARDEYVRALRGREDLSDFLLKHAAGALTPEERRRAGLLLELQRQAMLMYTSCGWFFDDVGRIETRQILRYAARLIELGRELSSEDWEPEFLQDLAPAVSNYEVVGDGARVYLECALEGRKLAGERA